MRQNGFSIIITVAIVLLLSIVGVFVYLKIINPNNTFFNKDNANRTITTNLLKITVPDKWNYEYITEGENPENTSYLMSIGPEIEFDNTFQTLTKNATGALMIIALESKDTEPLDDSVIFTKLKDTTIDNNKTIFYKRTIHSNPPETNYWALIWSEDYMIIVNFQSDNYELFENIINTIKLI